MTNLNLIVLSYHVFTRAPDDYVFSRTYKQFINDLETKEFDLITIDDANTSVYDACIILNEKNIRAKLFVTTSLVGTDGYLSWRQLKELSMFHDTENHSHLHVNLTQLPPEDIDWNIRTANRIIENEIGRRPRYFVAPWNQYNEDVIRIAGDFKLQIINGRDTIKNNSE